MKPLTRRIVIAVLVLALTLMPISAALAKGPPDKVIITGPGIDGELEITDLGLRNAFAFYQFNDLNRLMSSMIAFAPEVELGEGYHITRYILEEDGEYFAWDSLTYYPDPAGEAGYIFFDGLNPSVGSTQGQGLWFRAHPEGDAAMQHVMEMAAQSPAPQNLAPLSLNPMLIVGFVVLGSLLLVLSIAMQRRDRKVAAV